MRKCEENHENSKNEGQGEVTFCNPSAEVNFCDLCEFSASDTQGLETHIKDNHNRKPMTEDSHESDFGNKHDENIYIPEKTFKCELCEFTTLQTQGLKIHKSKMHPGPNKYPCDQCKEEFETKKRLKGHIFKIHSGKYRSLADRWLDYS